ncbi:MAG: T9SS type A sorting domain-containing protein, partial [Flavobacteriaceae bacterium]|nr:T9SS type A sorting domain-containing protein [Flavobacteriaceae bacterium]
MKKLLFILGILISVTFSAQVLEEDNYDNYTSENIGDYTDGTTPGQGDMYLDGGSLSDYQIVETDEEHGKALQITGSGTTSSTGRTVYKSDLKDKWEQREPENNILAVSIDIYTSDYSSDRFIGSAIIDQNGHEIVGIYYDNSTRQPFIVSWVYAPTWEHFTNLNLFPDLKPTYFPENTWITLAYTYDHETGETNYYLNGDCFYTVPNPELPYYEGVPGLIPSRHEIRNVALPFSTTGDELAAIVDNYKIEAIKKDLGTEDLVSPNTSLTTIYPNPVKDVFRVKLSDKFGDSNVKVIITDFSGKIVKQFTANAESYDISDLTTGVYLVTFDNGS